ncbi:hypothetical protein TNCV_4084541 [Trichonephila clavipes]|nr:hypothetical protein TNCV_4084541 [Trichonephila clavipes]
MATLHVGSQFHGLQCMVYFGVHDLHLTAQDFGLSLKQLLLREWDRLEVKDLRPTVEYFCKRLRLYIAANDGHFETN